MRFLRFVCVHAYVFTAMAVAHAQASQQLPNRCVLPRFRKLEGLAPNATFRIRTSGRPVKVTVISTGFYTFDCLPIAKVRFPNGIIAPIAADELWLSRRSLTEKREYLNQLQAEVVNAISNTLGLDATHVRVQHLDGATFIPPESTLDSLERLGPFLSAYVATGHNLHFAFNMIGFAHENTIFLHSEIGAYSYQTRVHETLHILSWDFRDEVHSKRLEALQEGLVEYFTYRVATPAFGVVPGHSKLYQTWLRFATAVAEQVGPQRIQSIFFGRGPGLVQSLREHIDANQPGKLDNALQLLIDGDTESAIQLIQRR